MGRNSTNNDNSAIGAQFSTVGSSTGFSAGDLVYRTPTTVGTIPDGAFTTASFPISTPTPLDVTQNLQSSTVGIHSKVGGGQLDFSSAKLSDGNIVVVYSRGSTASNGVPAFQIFDSAGAVVVAETDVSTATSNTTGRAVSVVAHSGGGFAVWWMAGSTLYHRGFDNTGTATYAATNSTYAFNGNSASPILLYPRSDDKYIVYWMDTSSYPNYAIYDNLGAATYANQILNSTATNGYRMAATVLSDNSFLIGFVGNSGTSVLWYKRTATNTAAANSNFGCLTNSGVAFTLLNNGNIAIYYKNSSNRLCYRLYDTGTDTVGSEIQFYSGDTFTTDYNELAVNACTIPGTDTNIVFASWTTSSLFNPAGALCYAVVDGSTGTLLSPTLSSPGFIPSWSAYTLYNYFNFIEVGSNMRAYSRSFSFGLSASLTTNYVPISGSTNYVEISKTTYLPVTYQSTSQSRGSASSVPVNVYSKSNSIPDGASFLASTTTAGFATITAGTLLGQETIIESVSCSSLVLKQLSNGNFIAAYQYNSSPYTVKFKVYNQSFSVIAEVVVGTGYANTPGAVSVCELTDGKIVVAWRSASTTWSIAIYSASYQLLTGGISVTSTATNSPGCLVALNDQNRFALIYSNGTPYIAASIFTNAGGLITGATSTITSSGFVAAAANDSGGAYVIGANTSAGSNVAFSSLMPTGATTYVFSSVFSIGTTAHNGATFRNSNFAACSPSGIFGFMYFQNGTSQQMVVSSPIYSSFSEWTTGTAGISSGEAFAMCATSENYFVGMYSSAGTTGLPTRVSNSASSSIQSSSLRFNDTLPFSSVFATASARTPAVCPFYGPYCVFGQRNINGFPVFLVVAAYTANYPVSIISGVTVSSPVRIGPDNGYSLIGVAASDCAAGGVGQVQTKGTAILSSAYPTTADVFDFTNNVTYGVKGTLNNRVINMED